MGRPADPRGGVDGNADVVRGGPFGVAAVHAHPHPNLDASGPRRLAQGPLHRHGRLGCRGRLLEHGEELVGARLDDEPRSLGACTFEDRADAVEQLAVAVAEPVDQLRRSLDVGEQHGHEARRQVARLGPAAELALGLQLAGDEPDRNDAEALGRLQQTGAGLLACRLVLEHDLVEAGQGVADVGGVVDRQTPAAARVDVGEGGGRQLGAIGRLEPGHVSGH